MKAMAVAMCLIFTVLGSISFFGIVWATDRFSYTYGAPYEGNDVEYTSTSAFAYEFTNLIDEAVDVNIVYKSEGNVREGNAVNEEELLRSFKNYYNIADGIITSSTDISDDYTVVITDPGAIPEDLMYNFYEYSDLVSTKLRGYRNVYIQSQLDSYISMKKNLDSFKNFFYYIENSDGSRVAGNCDKNLITDASQYIILSGEFLSDKMNYYTGYNNSVIADGGYVLYAGIPDTFSPGDAFYDEQREFTVRKEMFPIFIAGLIISCFAVIILIVYLARVSGQEEKGGAVYLRTVDSIYNDVHIWLIIIGGMFSVFLGLMLFGALLYTYEMLWYLCLCAVLTILAVIDMAVLLSYICSVSRQIKAKRFLYNTLVAALLRRIGETLGGKSLTGWVITLLVLYTVVCIFLSSLARYEGVFMLMLMVFVTVSVIVLIRNMESLVAIIKAAKYASRGEYKNIDVKKISSTFSAFAIDINNIQAGLQESIQEAVKGERMKADLITNVSHDLKTPLTSIITYVDLLKREKLDNDIAEGYVDVLVDKSQRLKQLIEDLIEASKASSGNLPVDKTRINLKDLILQACGEFEERAEAIGLEFRISSDGNVFVEADGKHMWRIYENLLSNVIKYAMPNSRVYIDIYEDRNFGTMIMKNVSHDEIKVNVENLAERFTRGDSSRTTEGSGLGLSIAKSLTVLQGGKFGLSVDGDMFKVKIDMPAWKEHTDEKESEIKVVMPESSNKKFKISPRRAPGREAIRQRLFSLTELSKKENKTDEAGEAFEEESKCTEPKNMNEQNKDDTTDKLQ